MAQLAELYGQPAANVLVTRGSDEAIDLLTRAFCRAGIDQVLVCPPTFGMYASRRASRAPGVVRVPLNQARGFEYDSAAVLGRLHAHREAGVRVLAQQSHRQSHFRTDHPAPGQRAGRAGRFWWWMRPTSSSPVPPGCARHLPSHPWLVVLRTLSKAYGLAGARCGVVLAHAEVIALLRRIVEPYNLTQLSIEAVLRALQPAARATMRERVALIRNERTQLNTALAQTQDVIRVWPSAANFLLVEFVAPQRAFDQACAAGLLVRDVRRQPGLDHALRLTVGTAEQNQRLIGALRAHSRAPAQKVT